MSFQPTDPWRSPGLSWTERNLPHLETQAATYFVTFRCRPGISLPPSCRTVALAAVRFWDGHRIDLDAAVVMPDHLHALIRVLEGFSLEKILHSIKSYSANRINRLLNRRGSLWQDERFDHIIRDECSWQNKIEYIRQNPVKKELACAPGEYPWLYVKASL